VLIGIRQSRARPYHDDEYVMGVQIAQDEASGPDPILSVETYLGFLVPGVVTTPIGAFSRPAAIAARMRVQNASSLSI
jgi:hypothetical protein